jgi:hypothetical protein
MKNSWESTSGTMQVEGNGSSPLVSTQWIYLRRCNSFRVCAEMNEMCLNNECKLADEMESGRGLF